MSAADDLGEVERIKRVYAEYRRDPRILHRWRDNEGSRAIISERQEVLKAMLQNAGLFPLRGRRILEIGCGGGSELARLLAWGAQPSDLFGVDLLPDRVDDALKAHPDLNITCANAERLAFADESFDLVFMFVLMSSILDPKMRVNIASEATRLLRRNGAIAWYDFRFNNPYNRNVRGVRQAEVERLFPSLRPAITTATVLPPLTRRLGKGVKLLYPLLRRIGWLRTHVIGLLVKPGREQ